MENNKNNADMGAWVKRMEEAAPEDKKNVVKELAAAIGTKVGEAWKKLKEAGWNPSSGAGELDLINDDPPGAAPPKTTPDEGKAFDTDVEFVCVQDCWQDGTRHRPGDVMVGRVCPPHFKVRPKEEEKKKE